MISIHYNSDFKMLEKGISLDAPFRFTYAPYSSNTYVASYDGYNYVNCRVVEDGLLVVFDNHGLKPCTPLKVRREYYLTDNDFKDGICHIVSVEEIKVQLTHGKTANTTEIVETVYPMYQKGDPFRYEDFTDSQLELLRGPKGEDSNKSLAIEIVQDGKIIAITSDKPMIDASMDDDGNIVITEFFN